jgi:hypothetical protein
MVTMPTNMMSTLQERPRVPGQVADAESDVTNSVETLLVVKGVVRDNGGKPAKTKRGA